MTQSGQGHEGQPWGGSSGHPWGPPPEQYPQSGQYGAAQPLPPEAPPGTFPGAAPGDADATQYLPPVAGGVGPVPPSENPAESTQFLGTGFGAQPQYPAPAAGGDAEATQYLPPVAAQSYGAQQPPQPQHQQPQQPERTGPPAEFDNLFRDDPAGATQHLPRYAATPHQAPPPQYPSYQQQPPAYHRQAPQREQYDQQPPYDPYEPYDEPARRRGKGALIAAVVVGCAVVGLGAGALMSGDKEKADDKTGIAAASTPTAVAPSTPAEDPAKGQAEALDKLLADSGSSRAAVIRAVDDIKKCRQLDRATEDLREAARQRRGLVTSLKGLQVDKLPDNAALTAALTKAWQASASADDHYAAWAEQVKGKKGCKDGKARYTSRTAQANRASGEATTAKQQAAGMWNRIATTYGLTQRQPSQL
ncbi:hypothetical protein [Streptomyces sp. NPDC047928]|uniref:hypothetical protein n=1 Tax=unclassified Streptomyces TaxID=2593676 RepID=UPI00371E2A0B